jgi:hypothetical protein
MPGFHDELGGRLEDSIRGNQVNEENDDPNEDTRSLSPLGTVTKRPLYTFQC